MAQCVNRPVPYNAEQKSLPCVAFLSFEFLPKRAIGLVHDVLRCVLVRHEPEREVVKPVTVLVVQPFEYRFIQNHLFLSFDMALYHTNIVEGDLITHLNTVPVSKLKDEEIEDYSIKLKQILNEIEKINETLISCKT